MACTLDGCSNQVTRITKAYERKKFDVYAYEPAQKAEKHKTRTVFYFCSAGCLFTYLEQIKVFNKKNGGVNHG